MPRSPRRLLLAPTLRLAVCLTAGPLPATYSVVGKKPKMADATRTLPTQRHDGPSSLRQTKILSCYLDYRTGGALLRSIPGAVLKSAEALVLISKLMEEPRKRMNAE